MEKSHENKPKGKLKTEIGFEIQIKLYQFKYTKKSSPEAILILTGSA